MYVMLHLSEKIQLDKIQPKYIFNPKNRLHLEEETRIKMSQKEVVELSEGLKGSDFDF